MKINVLAKEKLHFKRSIVVFASLVIIVFLLELLKQNPAAVEFIVKASNIYTQAIGAITNSLPFSLFEIGIVIIVLIIFICIVKIIKKIKLRRPRRAILTIVRVINTVLIIAIIYNVTASFPYRRPNVDLGIECHTYNRTDTLFISNYILKDYNALAKKYPSDKEGNVIAPYDFHIMAEIVQKEVAKLDNDYLYQFTPKPKAFFNSWLLNLEYICGITFVPTVEANINYLAPTVSLPFTMAHELAHARGVMLESDANYIATYALINAEDDFLRYSVYMNSFYEFTDVLDALFEEDKLKTFYDSISNEINKVNSYTFNFWNNHYSFVAELSSFFNDIYLKIMGQQDGVGGYQEPPLILIPGDPSSPDEPGEPTLTYNRIQQIYFNYYENIIEVAK